MISLAHALGQRPKEAPLWNDGSGWLSVEAVCAAVGAVAAQLPATRVALAFRSDAGLATALLAAEGRCTAVLLVPASWDQALLDRYLPLADITCLVTDRADLTAARVIRPVLSGVRPDFAPVGSVATDWIIPTSGTTGEPKLVEHRFETLARRVRTDPEKGRELVWGLVYELARFAGLQVWLQALLGGSQLVFARGDAGVASMVGLLAATGCNALSATPTLWRRLLMCPVERVLPLRLITLGGEIADDPLLRQLARLYPAARLTHIYASTEAGVGFSVTDGRAGFPRLFLEQPPADMELRVDAAGLLWLRPSTGGQRFLGAGPALGDEHGWINSGDRVRDEGDRCLFLGRANGAINVGGNKVYPEEVESCIRGVSGVRQVGVRARANPLVGSLVEAQVQADPAADRARLRQSIVQTCRASLAAYKVPAVVTWVDEVAVNAAGKLMRS